MTKAPKKHDLLAIRRNLTPPSDAEMFIGTVLEHQRDLINIKHHHCEFGLSRFFEMQLDPASPGPRVTIEEVLSNLSQLEWMVSEAREELKLYWGRQLVDLQEEMGDRFSELEQPTHAQAAYSAALEFATENSAAGFYEPRSRELARLGAKVRRERSKAAASRAILVESIVVLDRHRSKVLKVAAPTGRETAVTEKPDVNELPEVPPAMWVPGIRGRPPAGEDSDTRMIAFIRETYGPYFAQFRAVLRAYIHANDVPLYRKIYQYEAKGKTLPPDIQMPSERVNADERRVAEGREARRRLRGKAKPQRPRSRSRKSTTAPDQR